jgi:hypothetical protein
MKPGKVFGPETCRECDGCDGKHHFYIGASCPEFGDDEDLFLTLPKELENHPSVFVCKHCGAFAEAVCE